VVHRHHGDIPWQRISADVYRLTGKSPLSRTPARQKDWNCRRSCLEAPLPAEPARPEAPTWFSRPHGDSRRPQSSLPPPGPRPEKALRLNRHAGPCVTPLHVERLKHRPDFLRCARGQRRVTPSVTLETAATPVDYAKAGTVRVGFTATKKTIGGAVERNRAKRRLRAA